MKINLTLLALLFGLTACQTPSTEEPDQGEVQRLTKANLLPSREAPKLLPEGAPSATPFKMRPRTVRLRTGDEAAPEALPTATNDRVEFEGKVPLYGNLHSHSSLSGDIKKPGPGMSPLDGYKAAHAAGLDFLAITDHYKATDTKPRYWLKPSVYKTKLLKVASDYTTKAKGEFIAIAGLEWGTTKTGNHVNLIGPKTVPPDSIKDSDYNKLFAWAKTNAEFIQMNHPNSYHVSGKNKAVGNFGEALYPTWEGYVAACDDVFKTMSVICTVYGGHISGALKNNRARSYREFHRKHFAVYLDYLNMGFHLAPSANQDTHRNNWGVVTAARTVAWAEDASYGALMDAFRANRVYATEDDELVVAFQVEVAGKTNWMGSTVQLGNKRNVTVRVFLTQRKNTEDGKALDEGPYTVELWSDWDGAFGRQASKWGVYSGIKAGVLREISVPVVPGEYIFLRVTEENGQDNPIGDGSDEYNNKTGKKGSDGKRDNMNDSAWTAPIWFTE